MDNNKVKRRFLSSMTQVGLVYELLDRAVSDIKQGLVYLEAGDIEQVNRLLIHAQDIYLELQGMIKNEDALSQKAYALLDCLVDEVFYANVNRDRERARQALTLAERLRTVYYASFRTQIDGHK